MGARTHLRHTEANIYRGPPFSRDLPSRAQKRRDERAVCLIRNGVEPVQYRRTPIARRPATAIMIRCSRSVQLSDGGALELLPYKWPQPIDCEHSTLRPLYSIMVSRRIICNLPITYTRKGGWAASRNAKSRRRREMEWRKRRERLGRGMG